MASIQVSVYPIFTVMPLTDYVGAKLLLYSQQTKLTCFLK